MNAEKQKAEDAQNLKGEGEKKYARHLQNDCRKDGNHVESEFAMRQVVGELIIF